MVSLSFRKCKGWSKWLFRMHSKLLKLYLPGYFLVCQLLRSFLLSFHGNTVSVLSCSAESYLVNLSTKSFNCIVNVQLCFNESFKLRFLSNQYCYKEILVLPTKAFFDRDYCLESCCVGLQLVVCDQR